VGDLQKSIDVEKATREKEIAEIRKQVAGVEKRDQHLVENMVKEALEANQSRIPRNNTGSNDGELRKRQVVVSGLGEFEETKDMIAMLDGILTKVIGANHGLSMNSLGRGSKVGMLTFPSVTAKVDFYKRIEDHVDVPEDVHFFNNRSFEERVADKKLGLIKHLMVSSGKFPPGEIKIMWPQRTVALGKKRVAWFEGDKFVTSKSAQPYETEMQSRLKTWVEKRTPDLEIESE
jgi:hypothetical protein